MSTRCHITVKKCNTTEKHYVYHHCDGYLRGVGKELKEFIKEKYIPNDYSAEELCKQLEDWDSSYEYEDYGIHGDEEFLYYVDINDNDKTITVSVEEVLWRKNENDKWVTWNEKNDSYTEIIDIK